jgi:hypothetical protein
MTGLRALFLSRITLQPHREPLHRTQCIGCAGGGHINGVECRFCDQRGWFDAANPPPKEI